MKIQLIKNEAMDNEWINSHKELLNYGNTLKGHPITIHFSNIIEGILEITKGDIKTITFKNIPDAEFNERKNQLAQDIPGFIKTSTYLGWTETVSGKHPEAACFVYFHKRDKKDFILCLRKMKSNHHYKPYAIISKEKLLIDLEGRILHKEKPDQ